MVSPSVSTNRYILQPALIQKHKDSIDWLSSVAFWKDELSFFSKVLGDHSTDHQNINFKMQLDHFEHLINYYRFEVTEQLREKLIAHEMHLARMLRNHDESDLIYFREHDAVMDALRSFQTSMDELKLNFIQFIEGLTSPYTIPARDRE